jgi:prevent-host-death family protein
MKTIGVRELKDHISEVLEDLQKNGEPVLVTKHGRSVARITPISDEERRVSHDANDAWTALNRLAERIRAQWPQGVSAEDVLNDIRG